MTQTSDNTSIARSPRSHDVDSKASEMLPAIAAILRERGPEGFALTTIAEELGTSSRMLIYHFGSRDDLLGRVMMLLRRDTINRLEDPPPQTLDQAIEKWWSYYVRKGYISDMQLFFHIAARRFEEPERFEEFASTAVEGWVHFFADAIVKEGKTPEFAAVLGRLVIGSLRGIVVDYLITSDLANAQRSLEAFRSLVRLTMSSKESLLEDSAPVNSGR